MAQQTLPVANVQSGCRCFCTQPDPTGLQFQRNGRIGTRRGPEIAAKHCKRGAKRTPECYWQGWDLAPSKSKVAATLGGLYLRHTFINSFEDNVGRPRFAELTPLKIGGQRSPNNLDNADEENRRSTGCLRSLEFLLQEEHERPKDDK
jgi:hypothetical protein